MWSALFLLCLSTAFAAFRISRKLSQPFRWLSFFVGVASSVSLVPVGLVAAYGAVMCSSETTGQGVLAGHNLVWSIEHQGCGATTAGVYTVRLGAHSWWNHTILKTEAFPIPRSVEPAGEGAVRIVIDPDSSGENTPPEGLIVTITASGKPDKPLSFERGVLQ